ncbi:MAG TPA: hypothetical protein VJP85_05185 [Candidatus Baltobacteraceae bacterium]|nr:hypothetical protein [Candidatus Baltobacteraceae bacterium]
MMFGFQNGYQTTPFSVHWDGDDVLFEDSNYGFEVEVGKLGVVNESTINGFTVYDRDMTGAAVATHTTSAFSAWSSAPPTKTVSIGPLCHCQNEGSFVSGAINSNNDNYAPTVPNLSAGSEDGYGDAYGNTFQGVRAYDENTGQWTAPDAYAGDVHDPMSQKPFMWNRDNALQFSDPSGYNPELVILFLELGTHAAPDGEIQGRNISFSQRTIRPNFSDGGDRPKQSVNGLTAQLAMGK